MFDFAVQQYENQNVPQHVLQQVSVVPHNEPPSNQKPKTIITKSNLKIHISTAYNFIGQF